MEPSFNLGNKFNYDKEVSLKIELDKTCYSKGELITGTLILTPKENSTITELTNPYAIFSFQEKQSYEFIEKFSEKDSDILSPKKKYIQEVNSLGSLPMNFTNFENAKMIPCLKIPFQITVPNNAYPSCIFERSSYIIHFLTCEFESLQVKRSKSIIIKNNCYFSKENKLLRIPMEHNKIIYKHKLALISCGYFVVKINLEKNICAYDENLPIIIDIDCLKLTAIKLKGVKIYICRSYRKNTQKNKNVIKEEKTDEIIRKTIPLREGEVSYHVEDTIKLPKSSNDLNPEEVYKILDKDKGKINEKFANIRLFPTCDGGLLSCQYYLKVIIETNTLFSTNEEIIIPIDFYSPSNISNNENNNIKNINNNTNIIKEEENNKINLNDEINLDSNLNINQQVFMNENKSSQEVKEGESENKTKNNFLDDFVICKK